MKILIFTIVAMMASMVPSDEYREGIIGIWVFDHREDGVNTYIKQNEFDSDTGGIQFFGDGKMIVRRNAGWCGTPPIHYSNKDGQYEWINVDEIKTVSGYWGGDLKQGYKILSIENNRLTMKPFEIKEKMGTKK